MSNKTKKQRLKRARKVSKDFRKSDDLRIRAELNEDVIPFGRSLRTKRESILGGSTPFTSSLLGGRPGGI